MEKGKKEREKGCARNDSRARSPTRERGKSSARAKTRRVGKRESLAMRVPRRTMPFFMCLYICVYYNILRVETRHKMQRKYVSVKRETEGLGLTV